MVLNKSDKKSDKKLLQKEIIFSTSVELQSPQYVSVHACLFHIFGQTTLMPLIITHH